MNASLRTADRAMYLKIVLTGMLGAAAVVPLGSYAGAGRFVAAAPASQEIAAGRPQHLAAVGVKGSALQD
jgi:hypothetical protein